MRNIIRGWLGIEELEGKVNRLDIMIQEIINNAETQTIGFGNYKKQNDKDLMKMLTTINSLVSQIELLADQQLTNLDTERAKVVLRKLRYNKTKIENTRKLA